jgi:Flp pilus assembly protein TadD
MSGISVGGHVVIGGVALGKIATRAGLLTAALLLGACSGGGDLELGLGQEEPKSVDIATASTGPASRAELERATSYWGEQYSKNPRDGKSALSYARNLKALGRKAQALSVLQAAYLFNANDKEFLSEYGRLALERGQVSTAAELLAKADDPGKPDWRIISARGTVMAKQGNYKEAISYFERAREIAPPNQASVLNNLAMAYTMDGQAARGEELLRQASLTGGHDPKVKQNLALVLELQGKAGEAARIDAGEPPSAMVSRAPLAAPADAPPQLRLAASDAVTPVGKAATRPAGVVKANLTTPPSDAAEPVDADEIIRKAMEAEHAKKR